MSKINIVQDCCQWCQCPFQDIGIYKRSWSFGLVCENCLDKAGRTTQRQNKRCLKKPQVKGRLSKFDWLSVLYKHDFSCASCSSSKELTLDHKIKLAHGGANAFWNIQPLCVGCHREKDDM